MRVIRAHGTLSSLRIGFKKLVTIKISFVKLLGITYVVGQIKLQISLVGWGSVSEYLVKVSA